MSSFIGVGWVEMLKVFIDTSQFNTRVIGHRCGKRQKTIPSEVTPSLPPVFTSSPARRLVYWSDDA